MGDRPCKALLIFILASILNQLCDGGKSGKGRKLLWWSACQRPGDGDLGRFICRWFRALRCATGVPHSGLAPERRQIKIESESQKQGPRSGPTLDLDPPATQEPNAGLAKGGDGLGWAAAATAQNGPYSAVLREQDRCEVSWSVTAFRPLDRLRARGQPAAQNSSSHTAQHRAPTMHLPGASSAKAADSSAASKQI